MRKIMLIVATIVFVLHGLIHLMGTVAYLKFGGDSTTPRQDDAIGWRSTADAYHARSYDDFTHNRTFSFA